jgi:hypothetical protein
LSEENTDVPSRKPVRLPSAAKAIDERVAVLQEQYDRNTDPADDGGLSREDALSRVHGAAVNDVPRLVEELESYKAQRAKVHAKADSRDPGKKDAADETVELGQAHVDLERAVAEACAKELGLPDEPAAGVGAAGAAHDATVATKEG